MERGLFFESLIGLIEEAGFADETWQTDMIGNECLLVRVDDSDPDFGGGDCEWFTVVVFQNYVPTIQGTDCNWKEELEIKVGLAYRAASEGRLARRAREGMN